MSEIFFYFVRLGATGFGGPLALVSMMQKDLVEERHWLGPEEFQQVLPMIKAMPGPLAFQVATFLCYRRAGFWGALIGAIALVTPAALMILIIALLLPGFKGNSFVTSFLFGCQIGAVVIMAMSLVPLSKPYWKLREYWAIVMLSLVPIWGFPMWEPVVILVGGTLLVWRHVIAKRLAGLFALLPMTLAFEPTKLSELTLVSLKAGALIFGTGIAIIPLLEYDFVHRLQWLDIEEFRNAIAFGQITPGPVSVTLTYIGFKVCGITGAFFGTCGVFLPSFIHMTTWFPKLQKTLISKAWIKDFSKGAIACVAVSILFAIIRLGSSFPLNYKTILLFSLALSLQLKRKSPSWMVILTTGLLSML